jgi:hydroxymethylbilane synthase
MRGVCAQINDLVTFTCVSAERVVMCSLEGGCQVPIGAYSVPDGEGGLVMDAFVGSLDGVTLLRHTLKGTMAEPEMLGAAMVDRMLDLGADVVLAEIRAAGDGGVSTLLQT